MALSYRWSDLITLVSKQVKNIPTQQLDAIQCDLVSIRIANRLPWRPMVQSIASGQIPLIDSQQDYDPPFNIWRMNSAFLICTSIVPNDTMEITVRDSLAMDLIPRSPYAVTSVALQADVGKLRLSSAVQVPVGTSWELRGSYQINPTKVVSTSQNLWFDDRYAYVAIAGLKYYYFELADDPRAGTVSSTWDGTPTGYTGQRAEFMSALKEMTDSEDIGGDMQAMPDETLGVSYSNLGFMGLYGASGGGGGGTGGGGVGLNFADAEHVNGSGTNWSLLHLPNPTNSLQLYQEVPSFGSILLLAGQDYSLAGTTIVTFNSITAGALTAWYRY